MPALSVTEAEKVTVVVEVGAPETVRVAPLVE